MLRPRSPADLLFWLLLLLAIAWAAMSLTYPLGWDQAVFSWVSDAIIRGGMPYRDAWDHKGPLVYYLFALPRWLLGQNTWSFRLQEVLILSVGAVVLALIVRRLASGTAAKWAAVVFILWVGSGSYMNTSQPDGWVAIMLLVGLRPFLLSNTRSRWRSYAVAGLLIGCATLVKPFYVVFLFIVAIQPFLQGSRKPGELLRPLAAATAGFAVPILATVAWFLHRGALDDLVRVHLLYSLETYAGVDAIALVPRLKGLVDYILTGTVITVALPAAGVGFFTLWSKARSAALTLGVWIVLGVGLVLLQNRFFIYHWALIIPPTAILAAAGFDNLLRQPSGGHEALSRPHTVLARLLLALVVFHAAVHPSFDMVYWFGYMAGAMSPVDYYRHFGYQGDELEAAQYIHAHTQADDRVAIWGWNLPIALLAKRQIVSRFSHSGPLVLGPGSPIRAAYRREFMQAMQATPPAYLVDGMHPANVVGPDHDLDSFPELAAFVREHYRRDARFGELQLYRRVDTSAEDGR